MTEDWVSRSPGTPARGLVELTVRLTAEEVEDLEFQAKMDRLAVTDVIRRSLAIGRIAWETQRRRGRLMIQGSGGELRPVELPTARND